MPKYLLLKRYRGGPEPHRAVPPIDQWAPEDVEAHIGEQYANRTSGSGGKAKVESCSMVRSGPNATFSNQTIFVELRGIAIHVKQRFA